MDLAQCTKHLIYKDPFYGHISLGLQKTFSNQIPTACAQIQGMEIVLKFNEEFYYNLNDKQKVGLLQHELGHVCLFHLIHMGDYADKQVFNIAADITINQYIEGEYLPPKAMLPSSFPELNLPAFKDTKFYYDALMKACQSNDVDSKIKKLVDYMKSGGLTSASHPLWDQNEEGEEISDGMKTLVASQIANQLKQVFEENFNKNPGSVPGYLRSFITELYMKKPPILDWKGTVRRFKSFCDKQNIKITRSRPNKRYPDLEATVLRPKKKLLVGRDVSGSISAELATEFFTQIAYIAKTGVEVDVIDWDFGIQDKYKFNPKNPWAGGKGNKGGGGTNPYEVVEHFNKSRDHNALIMFSDGYIGGSWDKKVCKPILWIINSTGTTSFNFPGKKILIPNL